LITRAARTSLAGCTGAARRRSARGTARRAARSAASCATRSTLSRRKRRQLIGRHHRRGGESRRPIQALMTRAAVDARAEVTGVDRLDDLDHVARVRLVFVSAS
jgi:hypothetical protein